ncbi:MAG: hypothetical protein WBP40_03835 [Candidatus Moraniibacteriota bacterium]
MTPLDNRVESCYTGKVKEAGERVKARFLIFLHCSVRKTKYKNKKKSAKTLSTNFGTGVPVPRGSTYYRPAAHINDSALGLGSWADYHFWPKK